MLVTEMRRVTPERAPGQPFPDEAVESYASMRAQGTAPKQAAAATGLEKQHKQLERAADFQRRVQELKAGATPVDSALTLEWIIAELKRNVAGARLVQQFKSANEALGRLYEIFDKHHEQLGHDPQDELSTQDEPVSLDERRGYLRTELSAPAALEAAS